jgi:hypothetical protein
MRTATIFVILFYAFIAPTHAQAQQTAPLNNPPLQVFNVTTYGAAGDGKTDDTLAIQKTIDIAPSGSLIFIPSTAKFYIVSNLTINRPLTLVGESWGAQLKAKAGSSGYLLNITAGSERSAEGHLAGVFVRSLSLDGNSRAPDIGAISMTTLEQSQFTDLRIENFKREALNFQTSVRECNFTRIHMRFCGNADAGYPEINLNDRSLSSPDAHNFLYFDKIYSIFAMGDHVLLDTMAGKTLNKKPVTTRDIFFTNSTFHGVVPGIDGLPYVFTAAQKATRFVVMKAATAIHVEHSRMVGTGIGQPFIQLLAGTRMSHPDKLFLTDVDMNGRYSYTGSQIGVKLDSGTAQIENCYIDGPLTSIESAAGTTLYLGITNRLFGSLSINGDTAAVTLPTDLTLAGRLALRASQNDLVFNLNNTISGGRDFNIAVGGSASGNGPGGLYIYDKTANARRVFLDSAGTFQVDGSVVATSLAASRNRANSYLYSGREGQLVTTPPPTDGQLLIGATGAAPTAASISGKPDQIKVTNGAGSITLSLPQSISTTSSPTFAGITFNRYNSTPQAISIADNGVGSSPAVFTLTPTTSLIKITCNDPDGCTTTLDRTRAVDGYELNIINVGAYSVTFSDTNGLSELSGPFVMGRWDSLKLQFVTDRFVELSRSYNSKK